jgi:hypothetical protein
MFFIVVDQLTTTTTTTTTALVEAANIDDNFSSNLPIAVIDTNGVAIDSKAVYVDAQLTLIADGADNGRNRLTDHPSGPNSYVGETQVRLRGHSALQFPKKSYTVKLASASTTTGLPAARTWVLYGSGGYQDLSYRRNYWIYTVARQAGEYASRGHFVEVFVHDGNASQTLSEQYRGVYLWMEKIEQGVNRVNIAPSSPTDPDRGYIISQDKSDSSDIKYPGPCPANVAKYPKQPNAEQLQFGGQSINGFCAKTSGVQSLINLTTFADVWLFEQLVANPDSFNSNSKRMSRKGGARRE